MQAVTIIITNMATVRKTAKWKTE